MFRTFSTRYLPFVATLGLLLLTACVDPGTQLHDQTNRTRTSECAGKACFFVNSPVKTLPQAVRIPGRSALFYPTARSLEFVDNGQDHWTAPKFTLTDGASIPRLFQPFVGDAQTPSFRNAAALHDAYCGVGNELLPEYHGDRWQKVHRMFYDTLVVGGTPKLKAKVMFAAVWLGGPRWYLNKKPDSRLARLPDEIKIAAFLQTKSYIEGQNPDLPALIDYMTWREVWMFAQKPDRDSSSNERAALNVPIIAPGGGIAGGGGGIGPIGGGGGASCANKNDPACAAGASP